MHEEEINDIYKNLHQGIWIDLFPLIKAARNTHILHFQLLLIRKMQIMRFWFRKDVTFKSKVWNQILNFLYKVINFIVIFIGSSKSNYYIVKGNEFYSDDYKDKLNKILIPREYIESREKYVFNDNLLYGPKNYDGYLSMVYGNNYMIPKKYAHNVDYSKVKI